MKTNTTIFSLGILLCLSIVNPQAIQAQCPYDNVQFGTSPAPTIPNVSLTLTTAMFGGEFRRVTGMISGSQYRFETCGSSYDTQISIYTMGGGPMLASNDDFCGLQSQLDFTPTTTATYDILVDQFFCTSNTTPTTLIATLLSVASPIPATCLQTFNMPYAEDFESFGLCPTGCSSTCQSQIPATSGWRNATTDNHDWLVDRAGTASSRTGPSGPNWASNSGTDFNPGTTSGKYIYIESSGCFNSTSNLISPCILVSGTCPQMTFAYAMYGTAMGSLNVAISTDMGMTWGAPVFTRSGNQGAAWHVGSIDLTSHIGQTLSFRFAGTRGTSFRADIAIDDIKIIDASSGSALFSGLPAFISTQDLAVTLNPSSAGGTFTISPPTIALQGNIFDPANSTAGTTYTISYTVGPNVPGCQLSSSQTVFVTGVICQTPVVSSFPYVEDFENWNNCSTICGNPCPVPASASVWVQDNTDDMDWTVDIGGTNSFRTGPSVDFNPGSSNGKYLYTESSGFSCNNATANLLSPCFDLTSTSCPVVYIAYHLYGTQMANTTFNLDISTDGGNVWTNLFTDSGNKGDVWNLAHINISSYSGIARFRMQGQTGGFSTDIAIDYFQLIDLSTASPAFTGLGTTACLSAGDLTLVPIIAGGNFSGRGITGNVFNTIAAGPGLHTITYSLGQGQPNACQQSSSQQIFIPVPPLIAVSPDVTICEGDSTSLSASSPVCSNASSSCGFAWDTGDSGATTTVSPVAGVHSFSVTVTGTTGCQNTTSVNVMVIGSPDFTGLADTVCTSAGPQTLYANNPGGSFYGAGVNGMTFDPAIAGPGLHIISHNFPPNNLSCATHAEQQVFVPIPPTISITGLTVACEGDSVLLSATSNSFPCSPGSSSQETFIPAAHNNIFSGTLTRGYWFTAQSNMLISGARVPTDANASGSQYIQIVKILDPNVANWTFINQTNNFTTEFYAANIPGNSFINMSVQVNAGDIIGVLGARSSNNNTMNNSYTAAGAKTIPVLGKPTTFRRFGTQQPLSSPANQVWTEINGSLGRVELSVSSGLACALIWSNGDQGSSIMVAPTPGLHAYTATVIDFNGCSTSATHSLFVNAAPSLNAGADQIICENDCANLSATTGGGIISYLWTSGNTTLGNAADLTVCPVVTTTYTVTVVDTNGCSNTDDVTVEVDPAPRVTFMATDPLCFGFCDGTINTTLVSGGGGSTNFMYTGAAQQLVIPPGVSSITLEVWGGMGSTNNHNTQSQIGGMGGYATGDLAVSTGDVLTIMVGGGGGVQQSANFNGGGASGASNCAIARGGAGGGASDIRLNGTSLSNRVIVAGGGGGAGGTRSQGCGSGTGGGGGGGYNGGGAGGSYNGFPGLGGSQTSGGNGGVGFFGGQAGQAGSFGQGGNGGNTPNNNQGGTNQGPTGGTGGGVNGSNGTTGNPFWRGGGGGGGSGYIGGVTNGSMMNGVRMGNGMVVVFGLPAVSYIWTGPNGFTSFDEDLTGLCSGTYDVNVINNSTGCDSSYSVTLVDPPLLVADAGACATVYYGYNGPGGMPCATLSSSGTVGGTSPYTYMWSNGETSADVTVCPDTTTIYTVVITDANGCVDDDTVVVQSINVACGPDCEPGVVVCYTPLKTSKSKSTKTTKSTKASKLPLNWCVPAQCAPEILALMNVNIGPCNQISCDLINAGQIPPAFFLGKPSKTSKSTKTSDDVIKYKKSQGYVGFKSCKTKSIKTTKSSKKSKTTEEIRQKFCKKTWKFFKISTKSSKNKNNLGDQAQSGFNEIKVEAFPNPFQTTTTIRFTLPQADNVTITVTSVTGANFPLFEGAVEANVANTVEFNGENLSSGIYFYELITESGEIKTGKLNLIK